MDDISSTSPISMTSSDLTQLPPGGVVDHGRSLNNGTIEDHHNGTTGIQKILAEKGPIFDAMEAYLFGIMVYPLGVVIGYIIIGLLGNFVVFYVFFGKWKRNKTSVFIIALALLDIFNCSVNMPIEISILSKPISFDFDILCKVSRYLSYVTTASYSFVLVAIAFDRYLMVCRPLKRMTLGKRYAIRTCIAAVALGVITEWPSVIIYGTFTFEIPVPMNNTEANIFVLGRTCLVTNEHLYEDTTVTYAFQGFLFTGHVVIFSALTVMYIVIGRRLYISSHSDLETKGTGKRMLKESLVSAITGSVCCGSRTKSISVEALPYRRNKKHSNVSDVTNATNQTFVPQALELRNGKSKRGTLSRSLNDINLQFNSETQFQEKPKDQQDESVSSNQEQNIRVEPNSRVIKKGSVRPYSHPGTNSDYDFGEVTPSSSNVSSQKGYNLDSSQILSLTQGQDRPKTAAIKEISLKRNTLIMRMVTFTFMLSYLPFLIIVTLRYSNPDIPGKLNRTEKIIYHVFLRSYFFNSITRPFIYAVMNADYRRKVLEIFCRK